MSRLSETGFFFHPIPVLAVGLLLINDHVLKYHYPGWITGKLSDFVGLFVAPLFFAVVTVLLLRPFGLNGYRPCALVAGYSLLVAGLFTALKISPLISSIYLDTLRALGLTVQLINDPTDLIALPASWASYKWCRHMHHCRNN